MLGNSDKWLLFARQHHRHGLVSRNNRGLAGCHGNGAQVGRGEFEESLCRRDRPSIKRRGPFLALVVSCERRAGQSTTSEARVSRQRVSLSVSWRQFISSRQTVALGVPVSWG